MSLGTGASFTDFDSDSWHGWSIGKKDSFSNKKKVWQIKNKWYIRLSLCYLMTNSQISMPSSLQISQKAFARLLRSRYFGSIGVQSGDDFLMQNAQSDLFDRLTLPKNFNRLPEWSRWVNILINSAVLDLLTSSHKIGQKEQSGLYLASSIIKLIQMAQGRFNKSGIPFTLSSFDQLDSWLKWKYKKIDIWWVNIYFQVDGIPLNEDSLIIYDTAERYFSAASALIGDVNVNKLVLTEYGAETDSLTELPNRKSVLGHANLKYPEWTFDEVKTIFSVIYFDIDHFKQLNNFDHSIGDLALKYLAKLFVEFLIQEELIFDPSLSDLSKKDEINAKDTIFGRFWWDEFIMMMRWVWYEESSKIAQRWVEYIGTKPFEFEHKGQKRSHFIQVSPGVSTCDPQNVRKDGFDRYMNNQDKRDGEKFPPVLSYMTHLSDIAAMRSKRKWRNQSSHIFDPYNPTFRSLFEAELIETILGNLRSTISIEEAEWIINGTLTYQSLFNIWRKVRKQMLKDKELLND
jgi:GGDEF domain-containing protein